MSATQKRAAAAALLFAAALAVFVGVGMFATDAGSDEWKLLFDDEVASSPTRVRLASLRVWADPSHPPPESIAALDGEPVRVVGLCRPQASAGGIMLVAERIALRPASVPPVNSTVWVPLPEGRLEGADLRVGLVVRAIGILKVGMTEIADGHAVAYRLTPSAMWVREAPEAEHGHHHHHH